MKIVLWLSICRPSPEKLPSHIYTFDDLWVRAVTTTCVPVPNQDWVYLWPEDDEDTGGEKLEVKRRYMASSGQWHVELQTVVVDPDDSQMQMMRADTANGEGYKRFPWWTYGDPDKLAGWEGKLRAAGWVKR